MRSFSAMISPLDCGHPATIAFEKRRAAEYENHVLRTTLFRQIRTGRQLIAELTGESAENAGAALFSLPPSLINTSKREIHDITGRQFTRLGQIADQTYAELDAFFRGAAPIAHEYRPFFTTLATRTIGGHERLVLEGRESRTIAFDFERCVSAQYRAVRKMTYDNYMRVDRFESPIPNSTLLRLHSVHDMPDRFIPLTCTMLTKEIVEPDRHAIVWSTVTTCDLDECDAFVDETGWLVLQRVTDANGVESVVRSRYVRLAPRQLKMGFSANSAIHPYSEVLANMVLAATTEDTSKIDEIMENLLIEDCLNAATD